MTIFDLDCLGCMVAQLRLDHARTEIQEWEAENELEAHLKEVHGIDTAIGAEPPASNPGQPDRA